LTDKYELLLTQFENSQGKLSAATSEFENVKNQIVEQHNLLLDTATSAKKAKQEFDEWNRKLVDLELELEEKRGSFADIESRNQDLLSIAEMTDKAKQEHAEVMDKLSVAQGEFEKINVELESRQTELNKKNSQLLEVQTKLRESLLGKITSNMYLTK
jgi:chromosome segregation ATPase